MDDRVKYLEVAREGAKARNQVGRRRSGGGGSSSSSSSRV